MQTRKSCQQADCHPSADGSCACAERVAVPPKTGPLLWKDMNKLQKGLTGLGYVFAGIIAVGSGISTAAAFVTLNLVTAGMVSYLIAGLIFTAGAVMNWCINKNAVPEVLVDIFGKGKPFQGLMEVAKGVPLSTQKKAAMCFGILLALSVGANNAVLTFGSTLALTKAFAFLAVISPAFPPIAGILAGVTLICLTALMLKNIADLIRTPDIFATGYKFFSELLSCDKDLPHNQGKTTRRIFAERITTAALMLIALPLAGLGLFMTMNACAAGAKAFLFRTIPHASVIAVEIATKVISLGLALMGRIPFTVKNTMKVISKVFGPGQVAEKQPVRLVAKTQSSSAQVLDSLQTGALYTLCVVNAVGNGLISVVGGGGPEKIESMLAGAGGTWNSFVAGASNINVRPATTEPLQPKLPTIAVPPLQRAQTVASTNLTPSSSVASNQSAFYSSSSSKSALRKQSEELDVGSNETASLEPWLDPLGVRKQSQVSGFAY